MEKMNMKALSEAATLVTVLAKSNRLYDNVIIGINLYQPVHIDGTVGCSSLHLRGVDTIEQLAADAGVVVKRSGEYVYFDYPVDAENNCYVTVFAMDAPRGDFENDEGD